MMNHILYHYFDEDMGPFRNLSSLTAEEALSIFKQIRLEGRRFASQRSSDYLTIRRDLERIARDQFIAKGGNPKNSYPHYMTLGACDWLETWYVKPSRLAINWNMFVEDSISFTYGDLFPTMRYEDNKPYRKQVYTKQEIMKVIEDFGFPQHWNRHGDKGPERYIEVQVWDDEVIKNYFRYT